MRWAVANRRLRLAVGLIVARWARLPLRLVLRVATAILVAVPVRAIGAVALGAFLRSLAAPIPAISAASAALHVVPRVDPVIVERLQHTLTQCWIEVRQWRPRRGISLSTLLDWRLLP